ncbi:hypothetical protein SAMN02799630_03891 [Paenibacillus sp. UNCCL117]|nr:hypothetical protein SAMN04488602_11045 [Paenibacillus sp. cl123]SFW51364.1 hypothetical protein SAMN02799630_03891 [Paenibacillus sp. UNCCL117]
MKKKLMGLISLTAAAALLVSACSGQQQPAANPGDAKPGTAESDQVTEAGVFPITKEKTTLKVMVRGSSIIENFAPMSSRNGWRRKRTFISNGRSLRRKRLPRS